MAGGTDLISPCDEELERMELLKAFDETKAGVKGLIDSGLHKIPKIFVRPSEELDQELNIHKKAQVEVPVIDLTGTQDPERRKKIVEQVGIAAETWGFFQVVNHGIPLTVLDGMIEGVRRFNEQDIEEKKKYYSRDFTRNVKFSCNYDLYTSRTANWRDSLQILFSDQIDSGELPFCCRNSTMDYAKHVKTLGNTLLELLSEALGLKPDHLKEMECLNGHRLSCHYYPACPEPELTIGTTKHSDIGFLTILLQSRIVSGLQVLHQGQWIDVQPLPGCLVINIGDLLQLVSNGKFRSIEHRVIANRIGPRISIACFLSGPVNGVKTYGPIEDLISEENPPVYREVQLSEYVLKFLTTGLDTYRALDYYKI